MKATRLLTFFMFLSFSGCLFQPKIRCGLDPKLYPRVGQDSRILEQQTLGIMDTTTCSIQGKIIDLKNLEPMAGCGIRLKGLNHDSTVTNANGEFDFGHLPPGDYLLSTQYLFYRSLLDTIKAGSGEIIYLKVGLGERSRDELFPKE
jgi:hypothetical protein